MSCQDRTSTCLTAHVSALPVRLIRNLHRPVLRELGYSPSQIQKVDGVTERQLSASYMMAYTALYKIDVAGLHESEKVVSLNALRYMGASIVSLNDLIQARQVDLVLDDYKRRIRRSRDAMLGEGSQTANALGNTFETILRTDQDFRRLRGEPGYTRLASAAAGSYAPLVSDHTHQRTMPLLHTAFADRNVKVSNISAATIKATLRAFLRDMDYKQREVNKVELLSDAMLEKSLS